MGWQDPSPRVRPRAPAGDPASAPGYGDDGVRLSFGTIVFRWALVAGIAALVFVGARKGLVGWLGPAHLVAVIGLSLAVALGVAGLALRLVMRLPESSGFGRRRWDQTTTFGQAVAGEAIGEVVGAIIDAATD